MDLSIIKLITFKRYELSFKIYSGKGGKRFFPFCVSWHEKTKIANKKEGSLLRFISDKKTKTNIYLSKNKYITLYTKDAPEDKVGITDYKNTENHIFIRQ